MAGQLKAAATGGLTMIYARIAGTGSYLPEQVLTNAEIAQRLDTSDEWIVSRTGIRARHIAAPEQNQRPGADRLAARAGSGWRAGGGY